MFHKMASFSIRCIRNSLFSLVILISIFATIFPAFTHAILLSKISSQASESATQSVACINDEKVDSPARPFSSIKVDIEKNDALKDDHTEMPQQFSILELFCYDAPPDLLNGDIAGVLPDFQTKVPKERKIIKPEARRTRQRMVNGMGGSSRFSTKKSTVESRFSDSGVDIEFPDSSASGEHSNNNLVIHDDWDFDDGLIGAADHCSTDSSLQPDEILGSETGTTSVAANAGVAYRTKVEPLPKQYRERRVTSVGDRGAGVVKSDSIDGKKAEDDNCSLTASFCPTQSKQHVFATEPLFTRKFDTAMRAINRLFNRLKANYFSRRVVEDSVSNGEAYVLFTEAEREDLQDGEMLHIFTTSNNKKRESDQGDFTEKGLEEVRKAVLQIWDKADKNGKILFLKKYLEADLEYTLENENVEAFLNFLEICSWISSNKTGTVFPTPCSQFLTLLTSIVKDVEWGKMAVSDLADLFFAHYLGESVEA